MGIRTLRRSRDFRDYNVKWAGAAEGESTGPQGWGQGAGVLSLSFAQGTRRRCLINAECLTYFPAGGRGSLGSHELRFRLPTSALELRAVEKRGQALRELHPQVSSPGCAVCAPTPAFPENEGISPPAQPVCMPGTPHPVSSTRISQVGAKGGELSSLSQPRSRRVRQVTSLSPAGSSLPPVWSHGPGQGLRADPGWACGSKCKSQLD